MQGQGERTADLSDYADYADGREEDFPEKTMRKREAFGRFLGENREKSAVLIGGFRRNYVEIMVSFKKKTLTTRFTKEHYGKKGRTGFTF